LISRNSKLVQTTLGVSPDGGLSKVGGTAFARTAKGSVQQIHVSNKVRNRTPEVVFKGVNSPDVKAVDQA